LPPRWPVSAPRTGCVWLIGGKIRPRQPMYATTPRPDLAEKMGFLGGAASTHEVPGLNHRLSVTGGVLEDECRELLQAYFRLKRAEA